MRGQDFTNWFDQTATPYGWVFPGQNFQVQSPIPAASATVTPDQWLDQTREALGTLGAGTIQADVSAMYAVVGAEFGMPRGRWTEGAQMLWNRYSSTLSATWDASVYSNSTQAQAIVQWLSDLESSGLGAASVKWIQDSAAVQSALSKIGGVAQNVPWVNIVVAVARYAKFWVNGWSDKMDSRNGLQDYSTDFSWKPNLLKTGAYDLQQNGAQQDAAAGQAVIQAIRGLDLTDVFSPTSSDASAELRDGRLNSNQPWRPGWSVGMDAGDGSRLGCVPGTSAVSRRYDASAPVFDPPVEDSDGNKICAPYWSAGLGWGSTGSYLPTLASLGSTLWQAASADSALMAGIDTTRAINRWRLACHHLAYEILNPLAWAQSPLSAEYGAILWANFDGSNQRCNFTATLETLWDTVGADLGWPALRDVAWQTRADMGLTGRPETSKAQIGSAYLAQWAFSATQGGALGVRNYDPAQSGWASSRLANIVGLQCAPVVALKSLRSRQRGKLYGDGEAPILLPYVAEANPEGPRGQARVDILRDLLQRPEICDVDAADVPMGPGSFSDAGDLRDAIIIAQSNQRCRLDAGKKAIGGSIAYKAPPPVVAPGLGLASPGSGPSGSPGSAVAALAAAAGLFWMMRR